VQVRALLGTVEAVVDRPDAVASVSPGSNSPPARGVSSDVARYALDARTPGIGNAEHGRSDAPARPEGQPARGPAGK
jgi:hypothetical protein